MSSLFLTEVTDAAASTQLSMADIIIRYAIYGAIIVVGLIALFIINRCSRPLSLSGLRDKCSAVEKSLRAVQEGLKSEKHTKLARRCMKIYSSVNSMIYASTRIIDEERDVTFEDVRTALQRAMQSLDEASTSALTHEDAAALYASALAEIEKADAALQKIDERRKKFGK